MSDTEKCSEALVRRAQAGERKAFAELADRYRRRLEAIATALIAPDLRPRVDLDDVTQEALARGFEAIHRFRWEGDESFLRWLGGIVRNVIATAARREKLSPPMTGLRRDDPGRATTPSRSARQDERFDRLQTALRKLTREQRVVLELSTIEGLKAPEIAARLGKTPEAVRQLLVRALRALRRRFGETESLHLPDRKLDFDSLQPGAEPGRGT